MKRILILLLFLPLISSGQPFKVKECRVRPILVNNIHYADIHIVILTKTNSGNYSIDSIQFNKVISSSVKISVLGKDIMEKNYQKNDSVLIQCNIGLPEKKEPGSIVLFYHLVKKPDKSKAIKIKKIRPMNPIELQPY